MKKSKLLLLITLCSTGDFLIIEAQEVSCFCESCIENGGRECPNQAYASPWWAINLKTGKTLVSDDYVNTHWITEGEAPPISNISNVSDRIAPAFTVEDNTDEINPAEIHTKIDWNQKLTEMESCRSINELQQYIDNLDTSQFENLVKPILQVNRNAAVDKVPQCSLPRDAPTGLVPVVTSGDGKILLPKKYQQSNIWKWKKTQRNQSSHSYWGNIE